MSKRIFVACLMLVVAVSSGCETTASTTPDGEITRQLKSGSYTIQAPVNSQHGFDAEGIRFVGVLELAQDGSSRLSGTYSEMHVVDVDGFVYESIPDGVVEGTINGKGELRMSLRAADGSLSWTVWAVAIGPYIQGTWSSQSAAGTFAAHFFE